MKTKEVERGREAGRERGPCPAQSQEGDNGFTVPDRTSDHSRVKFHHLRIIMMTRLDWFIWAGGGERTDVLHSFWMSQTITPQCLHWWEPHCHNCAAVRAASAVTLRARAPPPVLARAIQTELQGDRAVSPQHTADWHPASNFSIPGPGLGEEEEEEREGLISHKRSHCLTVCSRPAGGEVRLQTKQQSGQAGSPVVLVES